MTKLTLACLGAEVILTFETAGQVVYDAIAFIPLLAMSPEEQLGMETDVIVQFLNDAPEGCDFDSLVKISLQYNDYATDTANRSLGEVDMAARAVVNEHIDFLYRNDAKYYFQPDQRDDYEQAIVDRLQIASKTRNHAKAA
jgi:hypothetical protein